MTLHHNLPASRIGDGAIITLPFHKVQFNFGEVVYEPLASFRTPYCDKLQRGGLSGAPAYA